MGVEEEEEEAVVQRQQKQASGVAHTTTVCACSGREHLCRTWRAAHISQAVTVALGEGCDAEVCCAAWTGHGQGMGMDTRSER